MIPEPLRIEQLVQKVLNQRGIDLIQEVKTIELGGTLKRR